MLVAGSSAQSTSSTTKKTAAPASSKAKTGTTKAEGAKTSGQASKPVITISGVCPAGTPGGKAYSPSCQTTISEATLEKLINVLNPDMPPAVRRNLGNSLGEWTAIGAKARELGLENSPEFQEMMKFAKTQLLAQTLVKHLQKQAEQTTPAELQAYYTEHKDQFEDFNLLRVIVPRATPTKDAPVDEAAEKAFAQQIRDRLAKGEDAKALQTEAFKHAGVQSPEPPVQIENRKRGSLPPSQAKVFDLKTGEVSEAFADPSAFFVYKVVSRDLPPLSKIEPEVKKQVTTDKYRATVEKLNSEFKVKLDEAYFGPGPQQPPAGAPSMKPPSGAQAPKTAPSGAPTGSTSSAPPSSTNAPQAAPTTNQAPATQAPASQAPTQQGPK